MVQSEEEGSSWDFIDGFIIHSDTLKVLTVQNSALLSLEPRAKVSSSVRILKPEESSENINRINVPAILEQIKNM